MIYGKQPGQSFRGDDTMDAYQQWLSANPIQPMAAQAEDLYARPLPGGVSATPTDYAADLDWGNMAGAGIQAAGQAAGGIAQAVGHKAAMDSWIGGNALNRASSERMVRAQLEQNQNQFNTTRQMSAYEQMLAALNGASSNEMNKRALQRGISRSGSDGLTTAFLG